MEAIQIEAPEVISDAVRRVTGTRTVAEKVVEANGPHYYVYCYDHDTRKEAAYRERAYKMALRPYQFCDGCKEGMGDKLGRPGKRPKAAAELANAGVCHPDFGCGAWRARTCLYGHLGVPKEDWIRLCPDCADPKGQPRAEVDNHFHDHMAAAKKEWRGMNKNDRALMLHRISVGTHSSRTRGKIYAQEK